MRPRSVTKEQPFNVSGRQLLQAQPSGMQTFHRIPTTRVPIKAITVSAQRMEHRYWTHLDSTPLLIRCLCLPAVRHALDISV